MYNLGVYDGAVDVTGEFSEGDIASAVGYLLANDTIGDPIRGQTWGERTETYVALTEDGNALRYLKMRIDVTAEIVRNLLDWRINSRSLKTV